MFLISFSIIPAATAQEVQRTLFGFLNVTPSARTSGLGGVNVSLTDRDAVSFISNPATVSDSLSGMASFNYQFYVADIGHSAFTYLSHFGRAGLVGIAVDHFSYGDFDGYDPSGNPLSDFNASETVIVLSKSHQINNFRLGVSLKGGFASLANYRASAMMADIGGVFIAPNRSWQVGLLLKNVGVVISDYTGTSDSGLPIDVQVGATIKPQHMPFRFSITAYRLIGSEAVEYSQDAWTSPSTLQKVLRHFNFGGEILLHQNINLLLGYNYGTHQELKLENAGGSAGLSYGFSARIKAIEFVFSRRTFVSASAGYSFTLTTDVDRFIRKNK